MKLVPADETNSVGGTAEVAAAPSSAFESSLEKKNMDQILNDSHLSHFNFEIIFLFF
jgi:hypothetical protein